MKTKQVKPSMCPSCDAYLDAVTDAEGHTPKSGDYSVCLYCNCILIFTETLEVRAATYDEVNQPEIRKLFTDMYWKMHKEKLN